jgi:acetyltransferase-like isoleucine patch superfamily enzyme
MQDLIRFTIHFLLAARYLFWKIILTSRGGSLGKGVRIYENVKIVGSHLNPIRIGDNTSLMMGSVLSACRKGSIHIDSGSYIGEYCVLMSHIEISIGSKVMFGPHCVVVDFDHGFADLDTPMMDQPSTSAKVRIEDNVWIGAGVKILKGITIGKGAIIGAGSIVTKDIPEYGIAFGVPVRVVKNRLEDQKALNS